MSLRCEPPIAETNTFSKHCAVKSHDCVFSITPSIGYEADTEGNLALSVIVFQVIVKPIIHNSYTVQLYITVKF